MDKRARAADQVGTAYAAGILVLYPWLCRGYSQLSAFKWEMLTLFTLVFGVLLFFFLPAARLRFPWPTRWMAIQTAAMALSTVLSLAPKASFWGSEGYRGGLALALLCLLGYGITAFALPANRLRLLGMAFCLSGAGTALLGVANNFGWDPFGWYEQIDPRQWNIFFSTIGNVDYLNSLFCLWMPVAIWNCLRGATRAERGVGWLSAAAGFLGLASLDPGIAMLGLAFAFLLLLWCVPLRYRDVQKLLLLAALFLLAQWSLQTAQEVYPLRMLERPFSVLGAPLIAWPGAALLAVCGALAGRTKKQSPLLRWQRAAVAAMAVLVAALFGWVNLGGASLGGFDNFFRLNAAWATERGALVANGAWLFAQAGPLRWLVGYGPGMVYRTLMTAGEAAPYPMTDAIGLHNEYLELLVCGGLLGLGSWLATLYSHLRRALHGDAVTGWALGAAAYAGQAFFNNRVVAVFPLMAVLLGVIQASLKEQK